MAEHAGFVSKLRSFDDYRHDGQRERPADQIDTEDLFSGDATVEDVLFEPELVVDRHGSRGSRGSRGRYSAEVLASTEFKRLARVSTEGCAPRRSTRTQEQLLKRSDNPSMPVSIARTGDSEDVEESVKKSPDADTMTELMGLSDIPLPVMPKPQGGPGPRQRMLMRQHAVSTA